jgi:hypothetical protein
MISSMLGAILEMLPVGAIWLGVTRLTAAWNISDLDFRAFSDEMHSRSQKGGLTVLRLYRLSEKPDDELRAALQRHKERHVVQKFTYAEVDDISILWGPPTKPPAKGTRLRDQLLSGDSPTAELTPGLAVDLCDAVRGAQRALAPSGKSNPTDDR